MPIIKSAIKKMRQNIKKTSQNALKKTRMKQVMKTAKGSGKTQSISEAYKAIDKAKKAGIIHKNKAARLKSSISKSSK